ncbi:MAG: insulinase family protein [Betaproteobacteria bacterium]|nr:insulinase family protein [Betaproteobacteria bacterium]
MIRTLRNSAALLLLAASMALLAGVASAAQGDVREHVLGNGMKVVVMEDHRAPTVVSMVWYRAGGIDEKSGTTGVAHVLEHMMFKGTTKHPGDAFSKIIAAAGGRENAFTNKDYTAYFQQLHKSKLPLALELEADRMQNLTLAADDFAKEIKVVMEERRMRTDDKPRSLLYERFMAATFIANPYHWPVIGWMNDLENMTIEDARNWYRTWYAPNNAMLVVIGDVTPDDVFDLADKNFGAIPARALPARKPQVEPAQRGTRRITLKAPGELPYLLMGWHVPVLRDVEHDWEPYALDVLVGVLDGSDAARLDRDLVRQQGVALSAGASYDDVNRGPGVFMLDAVPAKGKSVADVESALRREVGRIVDEGVSDEELKRVKTQVIAQQVFQRDSMFYQAMQMGVLGTSGLPYDSAAAQVRKLRGITAEQVRDVARKYLVDDTLTVAVLEPQTLAKKATPDAGPSDQ